MSNLFMYLVYLYLQEPTPLKLIGLKLCESKKEVRKPELNGYVGYTRASKLVPWHRSILLVKAHTDGCYAHMHPCHSCLNNLWFFQQTWQGMCGCVYLCVHVHVQVCICKCNQHYGMQWYCVCAYVCVCMCVCACVWTMCVQGVHVLICGCIWLAYLWTVATPSYILCYQLAFKKFFLLPLVPPSLAPPPHEWGHQ